MNLARCVCSTSHRALLSAALLGLTTLSSPAQTNESPIAILSKAPLSLPRLAPEAHKLGRKPVEAGSYEVIQLESQHHSKKERYGVEYLELKASADWQQKLRFKRSGANYISFTINASSGTQIDVMGAIIRITP